LARGERTSTTFDPLWEAASLEMLAVEATQAGLRELAESRCLTARRIIAAAAGKTL
jgi:hypothetical protein